MILCVNDIFEGGSMWTGITVKSNLSQKFFQPKPLFSQLFSLCTFLSHHSTFWYDFIDFPHLGNEWFLAPIVCEILQNTVSLQLVLIQAWIPWIVHCISSWVTIIHQNLISLNSPPRELMVGGSYYKWTLMEHCFTPHIFDYSLDPMTFKHFTFLSHQSTLIYDFIEFPQYRN